MAKLTLSATMLSAYATAKANNNDAGKKAVFRQARANFNIPSHVKLGFEDSPTNQAYGQVWVKGSNPRQFLTVGSTGHYSGVTVDTPTVAPTAQAIPATTTAVGADTTTTTPTPTTTTTTTTTSKFVAANAGDATASWHKFSRSNLLDILRDGGYDDEVDTPAGFPANLGDDAVVLDSVTGDLYIRNLG